MSNRHRVKTASQANFAQTVHADIPRSIFNRDSSLKTTFNCGDLVPIYCDEVLPGDTFEMSQSFISRLSTPLFPTMDNIDLEIYAYFVPNRLVWDGWEELNGENKTGAWTPVNEPALVPTFGQTHTDSKSIGDYYGLPVGVYGHNLPVSALPFRGYGLIWNEWFRDENLQAPLTINKGNSTYSVVQEYTFPYAPNSSLLKVNKFHDYFTSALPAPQKGDSPLIPIELNDVIPVVTRSASNFTSTSPAQAPLRFASASSPNATYIGTSNGLYLNEAVSPLTGNVLKAAPASGVEYENGEDSFSPIPINLVADGRGIRINGTTISELRTAFQIQKLLEKDARGGTRYIEMLKAHFGVDAGDYRLQRPEFLGRYKSLVGIQSVPQTSSTDTTSPQGNLAAYSVTAGNGVLFKKSFVEHGFIHIFAVARQVKTYQQGLEKFWSRRERFDFYLPTLAHISEQPILNKEIYAFGSDANDIFGYQEAWAEYRYKPNRVSGQMRTGVTNSLDVWHYADYYDSTPRLGSTWITDNSRANVDRTLAVSSYDSGSGESTVHGEDQIRMDIRFDCVAIRPMPVYSIPGLVDHF